MRPFPHTFRTHPHAPQQHSTTGPPTAAATSDARAPAPALLFLADDAGAESGDGVGGSTPAVAVAVFARPPGACTEDAAVVRRHTPFEERVEAALAAEAAFRESGLRRAPAGVGGAGDG